MKLLIIDDESECRAILAELLWMLDGSAGSIDEIREAGNLEEALDALSGCDAVICDGNFPARENSKDHWLAVLAKCMKQHARFLLHTGDDEIARRAEHMGLKVFRKPTHAEEIYRALTSGAGVLGKHAA
jgi:DNA-binding NarL/FixJ family response regulator